MSARKVKIAGREYRVTRDITGTLAGEIPGGWAILPEARERLAWLEDRRPWCVNRKKGQRLFREVGPCGGVAVIGSLKADGTWGMLRIMEVVQCGRGGS